MPVEFDSDPAIADYAHPERLVTTDWLANHLGDPGLVVVESDEDVLLYETGHIPGAVKVDWHTELNDPVTRDYLDAAAFGELMAAKGIRRDDTVVFYGDKSNWWAAYALWVFSLFGHADVRLLDGGRAGWLIDVRSPVEYSGERTTMPDYPEEGALRGGHIPTAASVPWAKAAAPDGRFRRRAELEQLYLAEAGLDRADDVIAYCRIGERSSHTWFVLTHLLGLDRVRNYDGSWTEWGNAVRVPIATGTDPGVAPAVPRP